jgi:hypothetical protein
MKGLFTAITVLTLISGCSGKPDIRNPDDWTTTSFTIEKNKVEDFSICVNDSFDNYPKGFLNNVYGNYQPLKGGRRVELSVEGKMAIIVVNIFNTGSVEVLYSYISSHWESEVKETIQQCLSSIQTPVDNS